MKTKQRILFTLGPLSILLVTAVAYLVFTMSAWRTLPLSRPESPYIGNMSGIRFPYYRVIGNSNDWTPFWIAYTSNRSVEPQPTSYDTHTPSPEINFAEDVAVVAMWGDRPHTGYILKITGVVENRSNIFVYVSRHTNCTFPASLLGCVASEMITQPSDVVLVPRLSIGKGTHNVVFIDGNIVFGGTKIAEQQITLP